MDTVAVQSVVCCNLDNCTTNHQNQIQQHYKKKCSKSLCPTW